MKEKIDLIVANPAGNTTIFVLSDVHVSRYQEIADKVLAIDFKKSYGVKFTEGNYEKEIKGEQVGFILKKKRNGLPAMNMSGLEFCGNASRTFAYYLSKLSDKIHDKIEISTSGCNHPLTAEIDVENNDSKIQMPLPLGSVALSPKELQIDDKYPDIPDGILVEIEGISHLVLRGVEPTPEMFDHLKNVIYSKKSLVSSPDNLAALGVMFLAEDGTLTPVVYVRDVNTTYFEGSCASGSTATAFVLGREKEDGISRMTFKQPAGTLHTEVKKESGRIVEIKLSGLIEISDVITVEI